MRYSKPWAALAVAAALAAGAGCITRSTYDRDLAAERARTDVERQKAAALQAKLDQADRDLKKAWDALSQKAADYTANQQATDDARRQVASLKQQNERLQNSVKDADKNAKAATDNAEKLKAAQDQLAAAQKENAALHELVEKQKAKIEKLEAPSGQSGGSAAGTGEK
jgi:chromosome segregation ATPase